MAASGRRDGAADQLRFVGDLGAKLQLGVEPVGQAERVALIGLEQPCGTLLDGDEVDGDVEVKQVLQQGLMIVPSLLHEHEDLFVWGVGVQALEQDAEAFARVGEGQYRAALEGLWRSSRVRETKPAT